MMRTNKGVLRVLTSTGSEEQFFQEDTELMFPETEEEHASGKHIVLQSNKTEFIFYRPSLIVCKAKDTIVPPDLSDDIEYPEEDR